MVEERKFHDSDLQEVWDSVHKWREVVLNNFKETGRLETTKKQLELEVKCLSDELSRYKTLVEKHEQSRDNWITMIAHATEIESLFSNLKKEKSELEKALADEKKLRAENEAKNEERRRNIEKEFKREIQLTKDSADKMIAEQGREFRAQLDKYKKEVVECQQNMENKISQYEEKLLKMNSELANAQVELWTLKRKSSSGNPVASQRMEPLENENEGSEASGVTGVAPLGLANTATTSQSRSARYFSQMAAQREQFARRFPSTSVKTVSGDDAENTTDDDRLTENEAVAPRPGVFKKRTSVRSFPAVKKKRLLPNSGDYF